MNSQPLMPFSLIHKPKNGNMKSKLWSSKCQEEEDYHPSPYLKGLQEKQIIINRELIDKLFMKVSYS